MFASDVTPAIITVGVAGMDGCQQGVYHPNAMAFAGIASLVQTIGAGPVGASLPMVQGAS
ncbi:MAG: hypothetical protein OET44_17085 [Gammaproteobacteria bacterium]|nr:hypothetical protein [Gammaproteobacteria bacterium]